MLNRRKNRSAQSEEEDVNVTPLLDIVFIMLIFFIVTATFIKEPGVKVKKPIASTAVDEKLLSVLVAITPENDIWINNHKVPLENVKSTVMKLRRESPKGSAVIQADAGSQTRYLLEVLKQVHAAGINDVAVSAKQS